ncbi:hypothetical protein [Flavobacterium chungbukense]|uniref:Uncharacterized protein n=1 Tax=Flavobacterium chungbukense TaxID=877464 RepID=A0ABP7XNR8_9FLAO|nr:hypothetical protein [Flavobacterium chungbukense]MCC4920896.1 hypothetical protein [Flavobacterium chungbukense]
MNAQAQDIVLQKLIDTKLLEQKEVKDFKEVQNKIEIKGSTAYLYGLFHCEYKRVTGHFYSSFLADMISIENEKLSEEEQKKREPKIYGLSC